MWITGGRVCDKGNRLVSIFEASNWVVVRVLGWAVVEDKWSGPWV